MLFSVPRFHLKIRHQEKLNKSVQLFGIKAELYEIVPQVSYNFDLSSFMELDQRKTSEFILGENHIFPFQTKKLRIR